MKPFISVVIPTYNRKDILKRCLEHLLSQNYPFDRYEIIVIDDGSADGTQNVVMNTAITSPARIIYFKQINKGHGKARNMGIEKSSGEIVLFLDDDSFAEPFLLEEIVSAFKTSSRKIAAVRGRVRGLALDDGKSDFIRILDEYVYNAKKSWATNNLACRKSVLEEVGGFDNSFRQCEDIDLGARIRDKGYDQVYWDSAIVWHLHETDIEMFRRKWVLGGMGLRVYFKKWLKRKPSRALMVIYNHIIKIGLKAFASRNLLVKEQFKSTLKGFLFPDNKLKTKTEGI